MVVDFKLLKEQIDKNVKKDLKQNLEGKVLDEFRKFGLGGVVVKDRDGFYCFSGFGVYFWFKESERISLKSLFSNPSSNFLLRSWVDKAKQIENEERRMYFMLVFTKNELPLMVIFPRFLLSVFDLDERKFTSYMVFYSDYVDCDFMVCRLREFLEKLVDKHA